LCHFQACVPFLYGGCDGDPLAANRFWSADECVQLCLGYIK
jgi:hypothetical protein